MTSFPDKDGEDKSPEVEIEIDPPEANVSPDRAASAKQERIEIDLDPSSWKVGIQDSYERVMIWFDAIPSSGKLIVLAIGALLGLTLIKTFLQLVSSLITLLVLSIIFYLVYKFWIAPNTSE
jgi:hypothetical protein